MNVSSPTMAVERDAHRPNANSETFSQIYSLAQRIQLMLGPHSSTGHVVGVTSCARRAGVSVVASNLAVCATDAYAGRVLLIDCDSHRPSVAEQFHVANEPGLNTCLTGQASVRDCLVETKHSGLFVLGAGQSHTGSTRGCAERLAKILKSLRGDFSLIVLDLPPVDEAGERLVASAGMDGVLLVLEAERTRRHLALRVARQLQQLDVRLLGTVMNKRRDHIPGWLYRRL